MTLPTKPGMYWRFGRNHDNEIVEQVVKVNYLQPTSDDLFYWEHGSIGAIFIQDEPDVEWAPCLPHDGWAHFWTCPHCKAQVPAWVEYCNHNYENVRIESPMGSESSGLGSVSGPGDLQMVLPWVTEPASGTTDNPDDGWVVRFAGSGDALRVQPVHANVDNQDAGIPTSDDTDTSASNPNVRAWFNDYPTSAPDT